MWVYTENAMGSLLQTACPKLTVAKKNRAIGPKRWNFGEGYGIWGQPEALKGGIPEKEIVIFEL